MKRVIPFLLVLLLACKEKYPSVPKDLIQTHAMEQILADMLIADALSETRGLGGINERRFTEQYYATIFKNHGVTRELFVKSYHFYEDNPVLLNTVYDSVLSDISKREAAVGK
jgi:Domain of unknown function (DUF4296)